MPNISCAVNVQIVGGPQLSTSRTIEVDAYDVVREELTDQDKEVEVQPATDAKRVQFLLINSTEFDDKLTYKVNDAERDIKLDGPQLFVGEGLVELLDTKANQAPRKLTFSNDLGRNVTVEVVVGRLTSTS